MHVSHIIRIESPKIPTKNLIIEMNVLLKIHIRELATIMLSSPFNIYQTTAR